MPIPTAGANQLRDHRKALALSLEALAQDVGVTATHLSCIERNQRLPSEDLLIALADRLKLHLTETDELFFAFGRVPPDVNKWASKHPDLVARLVREFQKQETQPEETIELEE